MMTPARRRNGWWTILAVMIGLGMAGPRFYAAAADKQEEPPIQPRLAECRLEVGSGEVLKPVDGVPAEGREQRVGNCRLLIDKDKIVAQYDGKAKPGWTAKSTDGQHLQWMAGAGGIAYFLGYKVDGEGQFDRYGSPAQVRRLNLETGRWLGSLTAGSADRKDERTDAILAVLSGDEFVAVLSRRIKIDPEERGKVRAYEVTCFRQAKDQPQWSRTFAAAGARREPGVYLFAAQTPDYADSSLRHLTWMGDTLVVCAEAMQPVLCLNPDTGSTIWRLERPWEFERGFIGPSVWSHYLERFRLRSFQLTPGNLAAARKKFDEDFDCAIVGGPVVVPVSFKRGRFDTHSIFLAVAKGPAKKLTGYVSDCILYEFNDQGKPVSMVKLPYMVSGSECVVQKDGIVWRCQNGALLRVAVAEQGGPGPGFGPGSPDLLARISWIRTLSGGQPQAWLVADPACDAVAFAQGQAFCLPRGGYVSRPDDAVYHFPVGVVDLESGGEQEWLLNVPFRGKLPAPETNYSEDASRARNTFHAHGPYVLGITQLRIAGNVLEVTLGMKNWSAVVRFDVSAVKSLRAGPRAQQQDDGIKSWLQSLGDVNKRDERGDSPLLNTAGDVDARYVMALLQAGADVKAKSKSGWTALMYASCYGTAEVVQLLIDAGSDVNARDGNCGGQTVLMWAAHGLREQKTKVRALIKAGADPKATLSTGWNALMGAANSGHLPAVELLLGAGVDVNAKTNEGKTALMIGAAQSDNESIVPVLLKAGADVHARDQNGRTPLMYAAEQGMPENINTLLAAGAVLNAKDKEGNTALDLARNSNYGTHEVRAKVLEEAVKRKAAR
jgi:ankyrin repeat protein